MKSNGRFLLSLSACTGLALAMNYSVRADEVGPYAGVDLGPAITQDSDLREFPGAAPGHKVKFDPGARLSLGGGYRFTDWFRAGGETGFIINSIDGADAAVSHVPFLAEVEFRLPNPSPIVPFIGGGPGFAVSSISIDDDNLAGGTRVDGDASDAVFAWQVFGGVRWKLSDNMHLGVVYKYFEAESPSWEVRHTTEDIRFGRTRSHSISASFSMDF